MVTDSIRFDLGRYGGPVYVGRPNGESLRKKLSLNQLDNIGTEAFIEVPKDTYAVNSSFFLGLFGPSIVHYGSHDEFLRRYHFSAPQFLLDRFSQYIDEALLERQSLGRS